MFCVTLLSLVMRPRFALMDRVVSLARTGSEAVFRLDPPLFTRTLSEFHGAYRLSTELVVLHGNDGLGMGQKPPGRKRQVGHVRR